MKEKIFKSVALAMCALLLSLSVVNASCIRVNAATVTHASLYKVADMALAKTGIVANNDIITSLIDDIFADVQTVYDEFVAYCESLSIDIADATTETWNDFVTQCTDAATAIINEFPDMVGLVIWLCTNALTVTMENIADYIVGAGTEGITNGVGYKIADEAVEYIKNQFDSMVTTGEFGYYYVKSYSASEVPTSLFSDNASYKNFQSYVKSVNYATLLTKNEYSGKYYYFQNDRELILVRPYNSPTTSMAFYLADWTQPTVNIIYQTYATSVQFTDAETFAAYKTGTLSNPQAHCFVGETCAGLPSRMFLFTADGHDVIVYTSLDALKMYNGGQKPYYQVTTNDYSTSVDNSIDFTGRYYQDNSNVYTYETIQNEIDNSTEINEETINNIVNTSTTTIVNNYYTTTEGDDSGSGDSSGSGGTGEGLAGLLDSIGGFLDFLLGLIGSVVELLTTFLNSALTLIGSLGSIFGNFGLLLGDLFSFIPQELIDAIVSGMMLLIFLAVYKAAKN